MNFKVLIRTAAQAEAAEAYLWYEGRRKGLGVRFADALQACFAQLAQNPKLEVRKDNFRHVTVEKFPYRVVFAIDGDTVYVYQIRHTSRRPSQRFGP